MLRKTGAAAILAVVAIGVAPAGSVASSPATLTVAADGSADYTSVQAAVDAAASGDTVLVTPGEYGGPIEIDKDLRLVGSGARETIRIVAPTEGPIEQQVALRLSGESVAVADLTVATPDRTTGVVATAGAPTIERVTFVGPEETNVRTSARSHRPFRSMLFAGGATPTVRQSEWDGYVAVRGASPTFIGNTVVGDTISIDGPGEASVRGNLFLRGSVSLSREVIGLIEGNEFRGDLSQIGVDSGSVGQVRGNTLDGSADDAAIWVADATTTAVVVGNTVTGSRDAMRVSSAGQATVEGNSLEASAIGIAISGTDALIEGNSIESGGAGVVLAAGANPRIAANTIVADGRAIAVTPDSLPIVIGNDICGGEAHIHADADSELVFEDNVLC